MAMSATTLITLLCACALCHVALGQVVTSLSRDKSIISGGLEMEVRGSGFNAGQNPFAVVTMRYSTDDPVRFTGGTCDVQSSTRMRCAIPGVRLPATVTPPDVARGQNPLLNSDDLSFNLGVTFDSVTSFREQVALEVYADPDLSANTIMRTFTIWTQRHLVIIGRALEAAAVMSDYSVTVTDQPCEVFFLNDTYMSCNLPLVPPTPDSGNFSTVRVQVGASRTPVGRVWYRVPIFAHEHSFGTVPVLSYNPDVITSRIEVAGEALMVGLNTDDYEVRVGQQFCEYITVAPTTLSCRGPRTSPLPTSTFIQHPDNYPQLIITVPKSNLGEFSYTYHAAYVRYVNHDYTLDARVIVDSSGPGAPGFIPTPSAPEDGEGDGTGVGDNKDDNGTSDAVVWVLVGLAVALALFLLCLLLCCVCCQGLCARMRGHYAKHDELVVASSRRSLYSGSHHVSSHSPHSSRASPHSSRASPHSSHMRVIDEYSVDRDGRAHRMY